MQYSFPSRKRVERFLGKFRLSFLISIKDYIKTNRKIRINQEKQTRYLEIGPGTEPLSGFEVLNIQDAPFVDYIVDISRANTPFTDNSFDLIYCSHVLEHIPWYETEKVLKELNRILKPGGALEVWVPDGLKICKTFVEFEEHSIDNTSKDGWYRFNEDKDPCRWTSGRVFTYGDGKGSLCHHNWHRALFSERFLRKLFAQTGFTDIQLMDRKEVRGYDHGWINLGVKGIK